VTQPNQRPPERIGRRGRHDVVNADRRPDVETGVGLAVERSLSIQVAAETDTDLVAEFGSDDDRRT